MKFSVDPQIFERFPSLILGVVSVIGIDNRGESGELKTLLQESEAEIGRNYLSESLSQHPKIQAWRRAYSEFGAKPKKYKSSVESLYRMVLKGDGLKPINKLVDIYNFVSLKHMLPLGGDDLDKIDGDIRLQMAKGGEPFIPLHSQETEPARPGEVVYSDDKEILCRRWNWRECDKTKMTEETSNAVLVVEALPPSARNDVETAAEELSRLVHQFCGGDSAVHLLDSHHPEIILQVSPL
jgi:DNA/RNA-binding domain of Phe-tRNA-synthetase-like protein